MKKPLLLSVLSALLITACGVETDTRQQTANQIARPAFMVERTIQAGQFNIKAWERMHAPMKTATVYIEGDSIHEVNAKDPKIAARLPILNSTPQKPLGLLLASRDKSENLVHLARPCQYIKSPEKKGCDSAYWQEKRFAPEVISAYESALNDIKARYEITGFDIVGYDGGANIAAVLAARRYDIMTLRTVAGNLSPGFTTDHSGHAALANNSVLAIDYGTKLARVPQHHFIGAGDTVITPGVYHSYRQTVGLSDCIKYSLVQDANHVVGWTQKWPDLLKLRPSCSRPQNDDFDMPFVTSPLPEAPDFPNSDNYKGVRGMSK